MRSATGPLRHAYLWLPPLIYMAAIFHFSSESQPLPELTALVWDKILHTIEYAGLGFLVFRALNGEGTGWRRAAALTLVIVSLYGASDEWHQSFVPMRSSNVSDWLVDMLGGAFGAFGYAIGWRSRSG
jgi:VanZ family protein